MMCMCFGIFVEIRRLSERYNSLINAWIYEQDM